MTAASLFRELVELLRPYAAEMSVKSDTETNFYLEETQSTGKPQLFGAVQVKKSYVAFHLFPLYSRPDLLQEIDPALRKRMQGKSCFNFAREDQVPKMELSALVKRAHETLRGSAA